MVPLSVLDLAPIVAGASAADAFRNTLDLARHAEVLAEIRRADEQRVDAVDGRDRVAFFHR